MTKKYQHLDENGIIEAIKNNDRDVFTQVYKKYYNVVKYFIIQNSGKPEDALDIYQEGMITVYENICNRTYAKQEGASLKTYIYSVCRYKWMNELRNRKKIPTVINDFEDKIFIEETTTEPMPYEQALNETLRQMGEKCREILKLFYYHKYTMEQIAIKLNYKSGNVAKSKKESCMKEAKRIAREIINRFI